MIQLFNLMASKYGLILAESQLQEIAAAVEKDKAERDALLNLPCKMCGGTGICEYSTACHCK